MNWKTKIIFGSLLCITTLLAVGFVWIYLLNAYSLSDPLLADITSPIGSKNHILFLEEGFQDRGITIFVKTSKINRGKTKRVAVLDWDSLYFFKELRWSNDGQVAVFFIQLINESCPEIMGFSINFSTGKIITPPWQNKYATTKKTEAEWKKYETQIIEIVRQHGGLQKDALTQEDLNNLYQKISFWQIPK